MALLCSAGSVANAEGDNGVFNHVGVGIGVGTTGIDIEVAAPITDYVQVRAGVSIMPKFTMSTSKIIPYGPSVKTWEQNIQKLNEWGGNIDYSQVRKNGQPLNEDEKQALMTMTKGLPKQIDAEGRLDNTQAKLLFDVFPMQKTSFHITAGFFVGKTEIVSANTTSCQEQLSALTTYNKSLGGTTLSYQDYPDINFTATQMKVRFENKEVAPNGPTISGTASVNSFRPYLGIGIGRAVPKNTRLAFACDLGAQFWGEPVMEVMGDKLTKDDVNSSILKTAKDLKIYPVLNFRLCGKIL